MVTFSVRLPIEKYNISGCWNISGFSPLLSVFEPSDTIRTAGRHRHDTGFDKAALFGTPAYKDSAPFHTLGKAIPTPIGLTEKISSSFVALSMEFSRSLPFSLICPPVFSCDFNAAINSRAISFAAVPVILRATSAPSSVIRTICSAASPEWFIFHQLLRFGFFRFFDFVRPVDFGFHLHGAAFYVFT